MSGIVHDVRPAEVGQLGVALDIEEDVLGLDVPVNHLLGQPVEVLQSITDLEEVLRAIPKRELPALAELVEHSAARGKLHAEVDMRAVPEVEEQLDNAWVPQGPKDGDLPIHLLRQVVLLKDGQRDLLDRKGRSIHLRVPGALHAPALPDLAEVATAQAPHEFKVRGPLRPLHGAGRGLRAILFCAQGGGIHRSSRAPDLPSH
mmetsp:Transcript_66679/g.188443  ORF Transcript_66679/g.188443 Transcript_66679/m.188443 type:complete len:203 (+) Transcript_66679:741-1349(+)